MNKYSILILPIFFALSNCAISPSADSQIVTSVQNGYKIELVASDAAYLNNIHIKSVENGLQVTGLVTHKTHKGVRIRGHVEVEVLDNQGKIIKQKTATINPQQSEPARRTHNRSFSVIIPGSVSKQYRIRIRHHIGGGEH